MFYKNFKFDIKDITEQGTFEGYASIYNTVDLVGDVIVPGAFDRTLNHKKGRVPFLLDHDSTKRAGAVFLSSDSKGLLVRGILNLNNIYGQMALADMKFYKEQEVPTGFSIGYDTVKEDWRDGVRYLKELRLWEVSYVTFPAHPDAQIIDVKTVVPYQDLPLADEGHAWDANAAVIRVRKWASSDGSGAKETMDWGKYQKAFCWYDAEDKENFGAYKLPIGDIVDDKLYAIPRGIFAVAAVLQGSRGGVDIPEADQERIRANIEKYYHKMDRTAPWEEKDFKYGRILSSKNEQLLRDAITALQGILEALAVEEDSGDHSKSTQLASDDILEIEQLNKLLKEMKGEK